MHDGLHLATAAELVGMLDSKTVSAVQVVEHFCNRIDSLDSKVQAFLSYDRANAMAQAKSVDERRAAGKPVGKLAGLPVGIKDLICARGEPATCASQILRDFVPPYDAHVIEQLRAEDAVLLGRLNMDEFAMGSSTEN